MRPGHLDAKFAMPRLPHRHRAVPPDDPPPPDLGRPETEILADRTHRRIRRRSDQDVRPRPEGMDRNRGRPGEHAEDATQRDCEVAYARVHRGPLVARIATNARIRPSAARVRASDRLSTVTIASATRAARCLLCAS